MKQYITFPDILPRTVCRDLRLLFLAGALCLTAAITANALVGPEIPPPAQEPPEAIPLIAIVDKPTPATMIRTEPEAEHQTVRHPLTDNDRDLVERVVMAEAGGEPYEGQMAVAQCILTSAEAEGLTPGEVATAPRQYAAPAASASESVKAAVSAVFDDGATVTAEPIRWFYAPARCTSSWHESLTYVIQIGGHRFFK